MTEEWRDIQGYKGLYQVSNRGSVRSLDRPVMQSITKEFFMKKGVVLKPHSSGKGYPTVVLSKNGKVKTCTVHRLVAEAFLSDCMPGLEVNHKDGNKWNNATDNLELVSHLHNMQHAMATGLLCIKGESHPMAKLTEEQVLDIVELANVLSTRELSKIFSVCPSSIRNIHSGKRWSSITGIGG